MSDTARVFLACALGSLVGGLIALQFVPHFWWIGAFAGGLVGYLAYDFPIVLAVIPKAYRAARGWRPNWQYWKALFAGIFGVVGIYQTVTVFPLLMAFAAARTPLVADERFIIIVIGMTITGFLSGLPLVAIELKEILPDRQILVPLRYSRTNPISMIFWVIPTAVIRSIRWTWRHAPVGIEIAVALGQRFGEFARRFSIELFREIHSDLRLLCGTDATLGAAVGYFAGNALIGAIAGGIFGVVNFEVLSIRVLKVVPATRSIFRS